MLESVNISVELVIECPGLTIRVGMLSLVKHYRRMQGWSFRLCDWNWHRVQRGS